MTQKPPTRAGYSREDLDQVLQACLTFAVTAGAHMANLCVVGGVVPSLLIDQRIGVPEGLAAHPGTNDLDIGLSVAVLNDQAYAAISQRLRSASFDPVRNDKGNQRVQSWAYAGTGVIVDFLLPPIPDGPPAAKVQNLEPDFGALIIPGVELAADEREIVTLTGTTLKGELVTREIPVCGPGAFIVLKALALADRGEPKDAFDLVYVLERWGGIDEVAARLARHAASHEAIVIDALEKLDRDFKTPDHVGPRRAAVFGTLREEDLDNAAADAHGYVDDLLRACRNRGLLEARAA